MIKFFEGPAAGITMQLRRAPFFLRVTDDGTKFDALDQPDDKPAENERLYVYRMTCYRGMMHLLIRGKNRAAGGFWAVADYTFHEEQPEDAEIRGNVKWREWCAARAHQMPKE